MPAPSAPYTGVLPKLSAKFAVAFVDNVLSSTTRASAAAVTDTEIDGPSSLNEIALLMLMLFAPVLVSPSRSVMVSVRVNVIRPAAIDTANLPEITHVAIFLGTEKSDKRPVMINSTNGRSYRGVKANGYGVYDFKLPVAGARIAFIGYGTPPGIATMETQTN